MNSFSHLIQCNVKLLKKLVVAVACAALCGGMTAQTSDFRIGLQLSPAFSWITTDDESIARTGTNLGITVGAVGEYYFSEFVALSGGMNISFNKGGTLRHDTGGNFFPESILSDDLYNSGDKPLPDGVKLKYSLQYLEFPLAFKVRTKEYGYFRYFVEAPILTWGLRTQARGAIDASDVSTEDENIAGDVNFLNISWGFGLGLEYAVSQNSSLVGGIYFTRGFVDVTNDEAIKAADNPDQNPNDPDDDYIISRENSKGLLKTLTIRLAMMF